MLDGGLSKIRPLLPMFVALVLAIFEFKNRTKKTKVKVKNTQINEVLIHTKICI